jgi:hypothetical protein
MNQFPPNPRLFRIERFEFFRKFAEIFASQGTTGINDTGGKIAAGINDTGSKFATGISDTGGKFLHHLR